MEGTPSGMSGQTEVDIGPPDDPDLKSHSPAFVHIAGDEVWIECSCGYTTGKYGSETEAREELVENGH